jgi:dipeptidyl aminopeptidase/acylaminoacyl peptidase
MSSSRAAKPSSIAVTTTAVLLLGIIATAACAKPAPRSIAELQSAVRYVDLAYEGKIEGGPGFSAELYSYVSAGLKVYAMVARPDSEVPDGGFPLLIANHGHHPDPPNYGFTADGKDWRPGDYYRRIPEQFAAAGFLVVLPDYRGHNNSEGLEYTEGMLESAYYTEDVLNLLAGLDDIADINAEQIFMWGHSMGGEVTLRALLATDRVKAASMWSSVGGDIWDQSYYYSRYAEPTAPDSSELDKHVISRLRGRIADLDGDFDADSVEPYLHLDALLTPIIIHHSVGDRGAAYKWSERLAKELYVRGKTYEFWSYDGDKHLFADDDFATAVSRDVAFFESQLD